MLRAENDAPGFFDISAGAMNTLFTLLGEESFAFPTLLFGTAGCFLFRPAVEGMVAVGAGVLPFTIAELTLLLEAEVAVEPFSDACATGFSPFTSLSLDLAAVPAL